MLNREGCTERMLGADVATIISLVEEHAVQRILSPSAVDSSLL